MSLAEKIHPVDPREIPHADGRRRRSQDSRARIAQAMLDLVAEGDASPSAERVAERAGVGLRTVFRLFRDMDGLYAQMAASVEATMRAAFLKPLVARQPLARLMELMERRSRLYETIAPYRRAALARRGVSPFLQARHSRLTGALRELLRAALPAEVRGDPVRLEALDLLFSFEAWLRLRDEQALEPAAALAVLQAAIRRLLSDFA